jgi:phenylacetate-coenzyme A ligase PaaK-like adenylate-forming protein
LAGFPPDIVGLDELKQYPFTTGEDISREPLQFLCVSQNDQRYGSPGDGDFVTMADLDDVLFPVDGVCNFTASVSREGNTERLHVEVYGPAEIQVSAVQQALDAIPAVRVAWSVGHLDVVSMVRKEGLSELSGPPKRMIVDWRTRSD